MKSWFFASMPWTLRSATAFILARRTIVLPIAVVRLGAPMPLMLEGGCFVTGLKEGKPELRDGIRIWRHVHRGVGAQAISLRILEFPAGRSAELRNPECDEVLYVLEGAGSLVLDGRRYEVEADTGIFVRPSSSFFVLNESAGSITIASAQCPEPGPSDELSPVSGAARKSDDPLANPIVRLRDRVSE